MKKKTICLFSISLLVHTANRRRRRAVCGARAAANADEKRRVSLCYADETEALVSDGFIWLR